MNFLSVIPTVFLLDGHIPQAFVMTSVALGIINLLPISGFDGGRMFSALAHSLFSCRTAERISSVLSFVIIFALWCFSVYLMFKISASVSLFVFSLSLFAKIFIAYKAVVNARIFREGEILTVTLSDLVSYGEEVNAKEYYELFTLRVWLMDYEGKVKEPIYLSTEDCLQYTITAGEDVRPGVYYLEIYLADWMLTVCPIVVY